jgi:hypothetical protein
MTIERCSFRPPINVDEAGLADLDQLMLFAQKDIIPPDHKIDITPPDYIDKYILYTKTGPGEVEDTIGEVQRTKGVRKEQDKLIRGFNNTFYTTKGPDHRVTRIDENTPIMVIAKVVLSPNQRRIIAMNLGEVVRYTPANKIVDENEAKEALYQEFIRMLHATVPVEK